MFNKMKYDGVQMCSSDVGLETEAAALALGRRGAGITTELMLQRVDCEFMTQKCVLFMA